MRARHRGPTWERGFASQNDPLAVECLLLSVLFVGPDGTASSVETYWRRHETNVGPLALRALLKLSGSAVLRACSVAYARLGACERLDVLSYCASSSLQIRTPRTPHAQRF